jgi:Rps23 Pro-64 3,4-dihydroxylase Tpa1-like proline 4-hydroxylase
MDVNKMAIDIRAIDNFFSDDVFNYISDYCRKATYLYGEVDDNDESVGRYTDEYVIGMIHQIFPIHFHEENNPNVNLRKKILDLIHRECLSQFRILNQFKLERMYINCFTPGENPYFHVDRPEEVSQAYTCLYYANQKWDLNEGGETQFYADNTIYGVPPVPNRMIIFDGDIQHRATSFRNYHRFTIALKYFKYDDVTDSEVAH